MSKKISPKQLLDNFKNAHSLWLVELSDAKEIIFDPEDASAEDIESASSSLRDSYDDLKKATAFCLTDDNQKILQDAFDEYHKMRKLANRQARQIKLQEEDRQDSRNASKIKVGTHPPNPSSAVQLKKLSSPTWDGTIRSYKRFRNNFELLVERQMSPEFGLIRLRESLRQDSREGLIVRSKSSLSAAWEALDAIFGKANSMRDAVLKDVLEILPVKDESDAEGLRRIVTELNLAKEDLKAVKRVSALGESAFAVVMEKIPDSIRRKIDRKILSGDLDSDESFDLVLNMLDEAASIEETNQLRLDAHIPSPFKLQEPGLSQNFQMKCKHGETPGDDKQNRGDDSGENKGKEHKGQPGSGRKDQDIRGEKSKRNPSPPPPPPPIDPCVLHPSSTHQTSECRIFLGQSSEEKKKHLKTGKRCVKCFSASHQIRDCKSRHLCKEKGCKNPKSHHTLIHAACLAVSLSMKGVPSKKPKTRLETIRLRQHLGHNTLRPSHKAYLKQKGQLVEVSLMYDLGATLSQIQSSVAKKVGLKPANVVNHLMMKTAGQTKAEDWGPTDLYNVPLYDVEGTLTMVINCVGVEYIGELDGGSYGSALNLFKDHGLDYSSLLTPVSGPIQILVGDNHAGVFPRTITSRGDVVLAETQFGQILHGSHSSFFIPRTNAEGMLLSGALDIATHNVAHCLAYAVSKDQAVSDFVPDIQPEGTGKGQGQQPLEIVVQPPTSSFVSEDTQVSTVKARSGSSVLIPCTSEDVPAVVMAVKTSEETTFDRLCALENSPVCQTCDRCPESETSPEEERRLQAYRSCLMYDPERKVFVCRLPWTQSYKTLVDNRPLALKRLTSLTRSMAKDDQLKSRYVEEFEKLVQAGYMTEVMEEEDAAWKSNGGKAYYICHFAHLNDKSASTPLRVIFDASVPFRGRAINSLWEQPPNLIPPIPMLLLRFQERKVPLAMDISKAYLTVHLDIEESHLHRLLWNRLDPALDVKTYRLKRNSWGTTPAGGICSVAMLVIAEKYRDRYPHVYEFVKSNLYVDDGTSSVDDVKSALILARDMSFVLGQASFKIKHFMIGGKDVDVSKELKNFDEIPTNVRKTDDQERILGVIYHSETDELSISAHVNFSKKKRGVRSQSDVKEENFDNEFPAKFTQRQYLQNIATVYDPTGIATPATIGMRHELGKIFRLKLGWDDAIPEGDDSAPTTRTRCKEIIRTIYGLKEVRFARCLTPDNAVGNPILAVFCDSSQNAYGCVAYYNWNLADGSRESRLAMAKAKPFPKTPVLTIPRGEMSGCVLGARIKTAILKKTSFQVEKVIMMTDSTIVLGQIRHEPYKFNIWTASRVDEIQRLTLLEEWYHIESDNNVADDASRGLDPSQMGRNSRWQKGSEFMRKDPDKWPITKVEDICNLQKDQDLTDVRLKDPRMTIARSKILCVKSQDDNQRTVSGSDSSKDDSSEDSASSEDDTSTEFRKSKEEDYGRILQSLESLHIEPLDKSDSWIRAKRYLSRVVRFIETGRNLFKMKRQHKLKRIPDLDTMTRAQRTKWYSENDNFVPTKREMTISALFLIRQAQQSLPDDVKRSLGALNPVKDVDGIWRAVGRTGAARCNPPILVPRSEPLAEVLVRHFHYPQHSGSDATLALVRQHYWIIDGQRFVNSFVSRCACCRFLRKQISQVEIAPRKTEQLLRSPVFQHVTLDIAGPFNTLADRRETRNYRVQTGKVWILVIVCRATAAVHIEVLEGYDTNAFLAGFDTFTRLRGKPTSVTADLGTQIRSGANVMQSLWSYTKPPQLQPDPETTTWNFVPSGAHASLGQAERMVQTVKRTLEAVTSSRKPEFTKLRFQRVMYHVMDIVNDRPLGVHRNKTGKLDASRLLRPNDLIVGRSDEDICKLIDFNMKQTPEQMDYTEIIRCNETFLDLWWKKWYEQIFPNLLPREKWTQPNRGVLKGDIVVIRDTNPIRNQWIWGEVDDVNLSSDGVIRTVSVRYKLGNASKFVTKSVRDLVVLLRNEERDDSS